MSLQPCALSITQLNCQIPVPCRQGIQTRPLQLLPISSHPKYIDFQLVQRWRLIRMIIPLPWASVHWLVQCTLECHWLTQCTLAYDWATQRILAVYTGTALEKLCWNSLTLECHWRNLVDNAPLECHWRNFCSLHWNTTGGTVTAHTRPGTYTHS